jgi:hypothetical protein
MNSRTRKAYKSERWRSDADPKDVDRRPFLKVLERRTRCTEPGFDSQRARDSWRRYRTGRGRRRAVGGDGRRRFRALHERERRQPGRQHILNRREPERPSCWDDLACEGVSTRRTTMQAWSLTELLEALVRAQTVLSKSGIQGRTLFDCDVVNLMRSQEFRVDGVRSAGQDLVHPATVAQQLGALH